MASLAGSVSKSTAISKSSQQALLRKSSTLKATVADLPPVVRLLRDRHHNKRLAAVEADLFDAATWPRGHDCILLANVCHDWNEADNKEILRNARTVLPERGKCVLIEVLLDEDRLGPLPATLYSVSMFLGDWRTGKQYTATDLITICHSAGFSNVDIGPNIGHFHTALIAYKD